MLSRVGLNIPKTNIFIISKSYPTVWERLFSVTFIAYFNIELEKFFKYTAFDIIPSDSISPYVIAFMTLLITFTGSDSIING